MQASKSQSPERCEILPPKQDEGLLRGNQEAAAVGIRGLHQLELLDTITESPRPQQLVSSLAELPAPLAWTFSLGTHVCIDSCSHLPPSGSLLFS